MASSVSISSRQGLGEHQCGSVWWGKEAEKKKKERQENKRDDGESEKGLFRLS